MDQIRQITLDLLNQQASTNPGAFSPTQKATLAEYNTLQETDPGHFESQGFARDLIRTLGQIPTGFLEGFTTLDTGFIEPRTESEKIARSLGSLLGFVGYIPNPEAWALKAAGRLSKDTAIKMLEKKYAKKLVDGMSKMSLEQINKQYIKPASTNLLHSVFPGAKSVPMLLTDKVLKSKTVENMGRSAFDLLASTKYLKQNKWINLNKLADYGEGMLNLGLASAISAGGINVFQWKERIDSALPAFVHGAAFGGVFRGLGNLGTALNLVNKQGDPALAAKLLQATAGAVFQGLPATMRESSTEEQVYEYLMGAWFGFHETPYSTRAATKKIAEINGKIIGDAKTPGDESIGFDFRTNKKAFYDRMEINKLPIDAQRILMKKLEEQFNANPSELANIMDAFGIEDFNPNFQRMEHGLDANGVEFQVPIYVRDPYKQKPIKNGAVYQNGVIIIDPQHLDPMVKRWVKEGFIKTSEAEGIDSSLFVSEGEIRKFIIKHELYHNYYESENLATAVAIAETLGSKGLARIPKDFKLIESLSAKERIEYERYIDRLTSEPFDKSTLKEGDYIAYKATNEHGSFGKRAWVVSHDKEYNQYEVRIENRHRIGEYTASDDVVKIPADLITYVFKGKEYSAENNPIVSKKNAPQRKPFGDKLTEKPLARTPEEEARIVEEASKSNSLSGIAGDFQAEMGKGQKPVSKKKSPKPKKIVKPEAETVDSEAVKRATEMNKGIGDAAAALMGAKDALGTNPIEEPIPTYAKAPKKPLKEQKPSQQQELEFQPTQQTSEVKDITESPMDLVGNINNNLKGDISLEFTGTGTRKRKGVDEQTIKTEIKSGNKTLGTLSFIIRDGKLHVEFVEVYKQGQGTASKLYEEVNNSLQKLSYDTLRSDETFLDAEGQESIYVYEGKEYSHSETDKMFTIDELVDKLEDGTLGIKDKVKPGENLWKSLEKKGLAEKTKNGYKFQPTKQSSEVETQKAAIKRRRREETKNIDLNPFDNPNYDADLLKFNKINAEYDRLDAIEDAKAQSTKQPKGVQGKRQYTVIPMSHVPESEKVKAPFKASKATKYIGFGNRSTESYGEQLFEQGMPVNSKEYTKDDIVFVSVNGNPKKTDLNNTKILAQRALNSGAMLLTDSAEFLSTSTYNKGEKALADYLLSKGYTRRTLDGNKDVAVWKKIEQKPTQQHASTKTPTIAQKTEVPKEIKTLKNKEETEIYVKNETKIEDEAEIKKKLEEYNAIEEEPIAEEVTDTRNVAKIKSSLALRYYHVEIVLSAMDEMQQRYERVSKEEFHKFVESKHKGLGNEAVLHFSNQVKVRQVTLDNGIGISEQYRRNTMVNRLFGDRVLTSDPRVEELIRQRIEDTQHARLDPGTLSLSELVNKAGLREEMLEKGINLDHYLDLKHPVGKYARLLIKMSQSNIAGIESTAPKEYAAVVERAKQNTYREYMKTLFSDKYISETKIEKVLKYTGQFNTDAVFSHKDTPFSFITVNDVEFLRELSKDSAYNDFAETIKSKDGTDVKVDSKPFVDGAIYISQAMRKRLQETFGLADSVVNLKPVIVNRNISEDTTFVGKGEMYFNAILENFMKNNNLDIIMFDTSTKVNATEKEARLASDDVSLEHIRYGTTLAKLKRQSLPENAIGFLKADKTQGKGTTTVTTQIMDTMQFHSSAKGYIDMYVRGEVENFNELKGLIQDMTLFSWALIENGIGATLGEDGRYLPTNNTKADAYIDLLMSGLDPFMPQLRNQTNAYMKSMIKRIAKPRTNAGEWATLSPDLGFQFIKDPKTGEHVIVNGSLKERRIVDGKLVPGEGILPNLFNNKRVDVETIWVHDNKTNTAVKFTEAFPEYAGIITVKTYGELFRETKKSKGQYDILFMYQSSPKQKPEDTLISRVKGIRPKKFKYQGKEYESGGDVTLATIDASIAAERDYDGDAGATILSIPKSLITEYTKHVLHNKKFRVGATEIEKANNEELSASKLSDYNELNDKIYKVSKKVGESVNRAAEYSAVIASKLGISYGEYRIDSIRRNSHDDLATLSLFAKEKQTAVDASKSNVDSMPSLLSDKYTEIARSRAFSNDPNISPMHNLLIEILTEPIANAIKFSNPHRFGVDTANKSLYDVYQAQNELIVLQRAERGELDGLSVSDVYGILWARKAAPIINEFNKVVSRHAAQTGQPLAEVQAYYLDAKKNKKAYKGKKAAHIRIYLDAVDKGKKLDWKELPTRVADMMIDPNTGEGKFLNIHKATTKEVFGKKLVRVSSEVNSVFYIPKFELRGKHTHSARQQMLFHIPTKFIDNHNLTDMSPTKWFDGIGGQHTLQRESTLRSRIDGAINNEALLQMHLQKFPEYKDQLTDAKTKNIKFYRATTVMLNNILNKYGEKTANEIAGLMVRRYMRQVMVYRTKGALDKKGQTKSYTKSLIDLMDFINFHGFGRRFYPNLSGNTGAGLEKGFEKVTLDKDLFPNERKILLNMDMNNLTYVNGVRNEVIDVLNLLNERVNLFRTQSGEWITEDLDNSMLETWGNYPELKVEMLHDPVSDPRNDFRDKGSRNSSYHSFLKPSEVLWNEAFKDSIFRDAFMKQFADAKGMQSGGEPLTFTENYIPSRSLEDKARFGEEGHFFPYGNLEKAMDATGYVPDSTVKPMTDAQKNAFQTIFQNSPQFANNFSAVLQDLIGKPRFDNHAEINFVINELSKMDRGTPVLGVIQRQFMPKWIARHMLKYDAQYESRQRGFNSFARPTSSLGRIMKYMKSAKADEQEETRKVQSIVNSIVWLSKIPEYLKNVYGLEKNGTMFTAEETPYIEQWKTMIREDTAGTKDLFRIAVHLHQIESVKEYDTNITDRQWERRMDLYKVAKRDFDAMDQNAGRSKQMYMKYLIRHLNKFDNHMWNTYWDPTQGAKHSLLRAKQRATIYMINRKLGDNHKRMEEIAGKNPSKEKIRNLSNKDATDYLGLKMKNEHLNTRLKNLSEKEQMGMTDKNLTAPRIKGYFHHYWETPEALAKAIQTEKAYEIGKLNKDSNDYEGKVEAINDRYDRMGSKALDNMAQPSSEAFMPGKDSNAWNPIRFNPATEMRESELGGFSTDIPTVMMKYAKDVLGQTINLEAVIKSRKEVDSFIDRMTAKWGRSDDAMAQIVRLKDFMNTYIRDSSDYIPEGNVRPKIFKYLFDKARGIDVDKNPKAYETPWSDASVLTKINKKREKQGKVLLPKWQAAAWANIEAKYEYLTLLTHPKYSLGNLAGGTINTLVYGGIKRFIEAGKLLKSREFKEQIEAQGIMPELMAYEFDLESSIYKKAHWGGFGKSAKEIIKGEGTLEEKRKALIESGKEHNVGQKIMEIASKFGTPIEQTLRQRAFTVGYLMAEENQMTGEAQVEFARDFVTATQYLYHNAVRPEFARTSLGKILTRFMMYFWSTMDFQKQMKLDAQKFNILPNSEESKRMERWAATSLVMMGFASIYPYSLFDSILPPHLDILKDMSELLFGDDDDKKDAFFGSYGLNVFTAPMPSRLLLRPLLTIANGDYQRYLNSEIYSFFPFGRFAKSTVRTLENPYFAPETFLGLPFMGIARDPKIIASSKKKNEYGYMFPGRKYKPTEE